MREANLNDALRDRFLCGIRNEHIQKKLLYMSDLTLQNLKAIAIATAVETASKDAVELQHQHWSDSDNKLSKKKGSYGKQKLSKNACFRRDMKKHSPDESHFKDESCNFCFKKGHAGRACLSKKAQKKKQIQEDKTENCEICRRTETFNCNSNYGK